VGQQQLLALAPVIDSASDAAFRRALRGLVLSQGCGVLTVTHRLPTALEADRIIVLDKGLIVEEGQPAELAASGERFAALLKLEAAGWYWCTGPDVRVRWGRSPRVQNPSTPELPGRDP